VPLDSTFNICNWPRLSLFISLCFCCMPIGWWLILLWNDKRELYGPFWVRRIDSKWSGEKYPWVTGRLPNIGLNPLQQARTNFGLSHEDRSIKVEGSKLHHNGAVIVKRLGSCKFPEFFEPIRSRFWSCMTNGCISHSLVSEIRKIGQYFAVEKLWNKLKYVNGFVYLLKT